MIPILELEPKPLTIAELYFDPARWCKGKDRYACIDVDGNLVEESERAVSCCLGRASRLVYDPDCLFYGPQKDKVLEVSAKLRLSIQSLFPERITNGYLPQFNDHPDTTFEDVMKVVNHAGV